MSFRFLHSSDLHLGRRFGNMPEDVRGRLREARHTVLSRLAARAREQGASHVLLAGDSFDTETPQPAELRQALAEMAHHAPLRWVLLPGNHDSLLASELWQRLAREAPQNVVLANAAEPLTLADNAILLPAPATARRPGRDLTEWMDSAATPAGVLRIGLAHGPIQDFSEDDAASDVIAPDRARHAGLDYLALGDWHGVIAVNPRTWYSGTPEPDRFKHDAPGRALLVALAGPGAIPEVTPLETASFAWSTLPLHLLAGGDASAGFEGLLPEARQRRQTLLRVMATGRALIGERIALMAAVEQAGPDFAHLELDLSGLETEMEAGDLDIVDRAGALRDAAEALLAESRDAALSAAEREVAAAALVRLFSYCGKIAG